MTVVRKTATYALFVCVAVLSSYAQTPPQLDVHRDQLLVQGVRPGTRVAWMAYTRERVGWHGRAGIRRGLGVVAADGVLRIPHPVPTAPYVLWSIATVDTAQGARATPPGMEVSTVRVPVTASVGAASVIIDAPQAHLLYVNPPAGAWFMSAADGGGGDADGRTDGYITIALSSLIALEGNRKAPQSIQAGDLVMVVDPGRLRAGQVVAR